MVRADDEDDALFQVPEELICPITHAVFRNPVITTVGTVYEERAIRQHLQNHTTDPLSNQKIDDTKLTPVFLLRSKAKQYATSTATRCLDLVLNPDCDDPAKYLRRACDICDEADVLDSVPQLPANIVDFAQQHRGAMHDVFLLINFATALAVTGDTSHALALFANLLRLEPTRPVQTAVIKRCLIHCWPAAPAAVHHTDSLGSGNSEAAAAAAAAPQPPPQLRCDVPAVLRFIRVQAGLRAADFVAILEELGVPRKDLITICQGLLHSTQGMHAATSPSYLSTPPPASPEPPRSGSSVGAISPESSVQPHSSGPPGAGGLLPSSLRSATTPAMGSRTASRDVGGIRKGLATAAAPARSSSGGERVALTRDERGSLRSASGVSSSSAAQAQLRGGHMRGDATAGGAGDPEETVAELRMLCAGLQEAMGVVPKLLALVEEEVRAEAGDKFAALEREIGLVTQEDGESSVVAPAGGNGDSEPRRRTGPVWAMTAVAGGVLIPGFFGRLALAAPLIALLVKR